MMLEWLPIDTAPKDGTEVLVRATSGGNVIAHYVAYFVDNKWVIFGGDNVMVTCSPNEWSSVLEGQGPQVA